MNDTFRDTAIFVGAMFLLFCFGKLWQGYKYTNKHNNNTTHEEEVSKYTLSHETLKSISAFNVELEKKEASSKNTPNNA